MSSMYKLLFSVVFRRMPAEKAHRLGFALIRAAAAAPGAARLMRRCLATRDPVLGISAFGIDFAGPLGLAAGFDKDARAPGALAALGFAFVETGTVTPRPQPGNPEPRLFRLPRDRALINRMGFNNGGAAAAAARLRGRKAQNSVVRNGVGRNGVGRNSVVGVNIGKNKDTPDLAAADDYAASAHEIADVADYVVVNVSSPNTPGLRDLQAADQLRPLLITVRQSLDAALGPGRHVPLLVKIAPDLADDAIDAIADLALELKLDGIIATNTTISRDHLTSDPADVQAAGAGGLSGPPLRDRALEVLHRLHARTGGAVTLVAAGGIETADDAWERIQAGATLVQAYTGFIYGGPLWPHRVQAGIARRVRSAGFASIRQAIGTATSTI